MDERTQDTAAAYDNAAADLAERTEQRSPMASEFFERFLQVLKPACTVADLGCGPGHDVRRLRDAGHRPVGLDRSAGLLALNPRNASRVLGDIRQLAFASGTLDAIWSSAALLHVDRAELAPTLADWDRALAPGAVVGIATSLGDDEGWELVPAGTSGRPEIQAGDQRWFVHHPEASLRSAVAATGWETIWSAVRSSNREWLQMLARKPSIGVAV